jgi:hypothetical protein
LRKTTRWGLLGVAVVATGCAVRLGGPRPVDYMAMVFSDASPSVADVADQVRRAGADVVLISAGQDADWFGRLAAETGLHLSGPGMTGPRALAFLTRVEALGDTSLVIDVPTGGRIHMHDALYRVDRQRTLDLMYVRLDDVEVIPDAARVLLEYLASDVGPTASVLLAVEAPSAAMADSLAVRMRAYFPSAWDCAAPEARPATAATVPMRLLYGPSVRLSCVSAEVAAAPSEPTTARVRVGG